jgi:antibiotic biosynthesis monooxygenase (ABM) superfamily enzyme
MEYLNTVFKIWKNTDDIKQVINNIPNVETLNTKEITKEGLAHIFEKLNNPIVKNLNAYDLLFIILLGITIIVLLSQISTFIQQAISAIISNIIYALAIVCISIVLYLLLPYTNATRKLIEKLGEVD